MPPPAVVVVAMRSPSKSLRPGSASSPPVVRWPLRHTPSSTLGSCVAKRCLSRVSLPANSGLRQTAAAAPARRNVGPPLLWMCPSRPKRLPQVVAAAAGGGTGSASGAGDRAKELMGNLTSAMGKANKEFKLDFGITSLLQYNFAAQLALTVVSWAVMFATLHAGVSAGHSVISFPILCNLVAVLLGAFSAWMSFTYFMKAKEMGEAALDGFKMMNEFFGHLSVNFFGAAAAIIGLQAEVGTMFASTMAAGSVPATVNGSVAALAQAAANALLAHLVSIVFLTYLIRKIALAYKKLIEWSEGLVESVGKLS